MIWENTLLSLRVWESLSRRGCLFYFLRKTEGMTEWGGKIISGRWNKVIIYIFGNPLQYSCLENPMDGGAW